MQARKPRFTRFRSRRDAEKVLAEIIEGGGRIEDYEIDEDAADGSCVITIFEDESRQVAGTLGA